MTASPALIRNVLDLGNVSGAVKLDRSAANSFKMTLSGNVVFSVLSVSPGERLDVAVTQDAPGGHSVAWNGASPNAQRVTAPQPAMLQASTGSTRFTLLGSASDLSSVECVAQRNESASGVAAIVDRLASLRALQPPTSGPDQIVMLGYGTAGDGGGGVFSWVPGSSATVDGGTVFASLAPGAPAGRLVRVFSGPLDVRWFGAVGDSNGSHGSGTDNTTAIQAALNAAGLTGGSVLVSPGTYRTTAKLSIPASVVVRGLGDDSVLVGDHFDHVLESAGVVNVTRVGRVLVEKLKITSPARVSPNAIAAVTRANPPVVTCIAHGLTPDAYGKDPIVWIQSATGMTQINRAWRVSIVDADHFSISNTDGSAWGVYNAGSASVVRAAYSGVHNLGSIFDTYRQLFVSFCMFGVIIDQGEVTLLADSLLSGNYMAQAYYTDGSDVTPTAIGGLTNTNTMQNCQVNGGSFGVAHDGGSTFRFFGGNVNGQPGSFTGQLGASFRLGNCNFFNFSDFDCESTGMAFVATTLLDANASAVAIAEFDHVTFTTTPDPIATFGAGAQLRFKQCQLTTTAAHQFVNAAQLTYIDLDESNSWAGDIYRLFDQFPRAGNLASRDILQIPLATPDVATAPTRIFTTGTRIRNTAATKGTPSGWVAPYDAGGGEAGFPSHQATWLPTGVVGNGFVEAIEAIPNLVAVWTADRQAKLDASRHVTALRELSGNRDANYDMTGHGALAYQVVDASHGAASVGPYDALTKWLATGALAVPLAQPLTIFLIGSDNLDHSSTCVYLDGVDVTNRVRIQKNGGGSNQFELFAGSTIGIGGVGATFFNAFVCVVDGASSRIYANSLTPVAGNAGANGLHGITLGSDYNQSVGQNGVTIACAIFDRALSNAECAQLLTAAQQFFGIVIAP